ncbi:hypothetical protein [Streptomyces sp. NPDC054975]
MGSRHAQVDEQLASHDQGDLGVRVRHLYVLSGGALGAPDAWDVTIQSMDRAVLQADLASRVSLQMLHVRFPAYDLRELTWRLRDHAAGRSVLLAPADWSTVGR